MSQLRRRATKVRETGAARRRNWNPLADSPAYQRYLWWQEETGYQVKQENYCRYWRITMIWAPLRKLANMLSCLVLPLYYLGAALAALTCLYGLWEFWHADGGFWHKLGQVVFWVLAACWFLAGALVALLAFSPLIPDRTAPKSEPYSRRMKVVLVVCGLLTFPAFLAVGLLFLVIALLAVAGEQRVGPRTVSWLCTAHFSGIKWIGWFRPVYALLAALTGTLSGLSFNYSWARTFLLIIAIAVAFATVVGWLGYLADEHKHHQAQRREEQTRYYRTHPVPERLYIPVTSSTPRQPNRFERFANAVAACVMNVLEVVIDFLALTWALLVAKKWGICPFVVLPTQPTQLEGELRDSGVQEA
jgi:MFS family permease